MFLVANELGQSHLDAGNAMLYAVLGYAIVFLGLILLMAVVVLIGKFFVARSKKAEPVVEETVVEEVVAAPQPTAPGSAGQLKLYDVEPKTAAMLMAIVADQMGKPINELRFISVREVK